MRTSGRDNSMEHHKLIIDQDTHPQSLSKPQPQRPRYEEIDHPQPLDKKWRDDFGAGDFVQNAI